MNYTHCRTSQTENFPQNIKITPGRTRTFLNPGRLTNLHSRIEAISPEWLEGIHLFYKRPYSQCLATTFNYVLSHTSSSGIRIGGIYYPRLNGDILVDVFLIAFKY